MTCQTITRKMAALGLMGALLLSGCADSAPQKADQAMITLTEVPADEGIPDVTKAYEKASVFPYFTAEGGETSEGMDAINEQIDDLRDKYEDAKKEEDTQMIAQTTVREVGRYEIAVVYTLQIHTSLIGNVKSEKNIATFAYDNGTGEEYTCTQALESTGIKGSELSRKMETLYRAKHPEDTSQIRATEMQGYEIDADGVVHSILMKLEMENEEGIEEEVFFRYDVESDSLESVVFPIEI